MQATTSSTFLDGARPASRTKTTYSNMNDWMRLQGRVANSQAPVMYTGAGGFQQLPSVEISDVETEALKENYEDTFKRSYSDLAHQIAYRYPNPGLPRIRQGAIGGTWRHIKEVLGHHGSRVCFVDGLVSVYDTDKFSEALQPPLPYKGKLVHPPYVPTQSEHDINNGKKGVHFPKVESDMERKIKMASNPRHKGHYQFK